MSRAQSSQTNCHPLDLFVVHSLPEQSFPSKCFLLFCNKLLPIRIWIMSIAVWKRGHTYKSSEPRLRNCITVLFRGNERKARPSENVIDHAMKVARKLNRGKKKVAQSKGQKEAIAKGHQRKGDQTIAKTKERETYSSAKGLARANYAKWLALKQRKDHGQNKGKARLAKKT